jgi:hypothetical protein
MLYFRVDRPCTCGGIISYMNWHQHFYFNTTVTLLAIYGLILNKFQRRYQESKSTPISRTYQYPVNL